MVAVVFAALSGLSYGASDFSGALASKRNDSSLITVAMQVVSLASLVIALLWIADGTFLLTDMWWGALGGVGAAIGLTTFYRALATGPMSTAAAVTGLFSAIVPVSAGLALGEIPERITMAGVALAIPAAVMVSVGAMALHSLSKNHSPRERAMAKERTSETRLLSIVAGLGFGLFFIALSRTSPDGGLFPLLGARIAPIGVLSLILTAGRGWGRIGQSDWPAVAIAGVLDCAANSFYLLALDKGSFTWVAAVSSLYPVSTVLLARLVLSERIARIQIFGMLMAAASLVLIAAGAT